MISTSVLLILPSGTQESDQCKKLHNPTKPPLNGIHRASSLLQTQNPQQQQQKHKINERKAYSASENKPVSERNVDLTLQSLCNQGHLDKALHILRGDMSSPLTTSTYLSILKECIKKKSSSGAKCVHAHITSYQIDLNQNAILGDYLVMALARCRELEDARALAESLPKLTIYSWTALISAYAEFGRGDDSLHFYRCMLDDGIHPDKYTFVGLFRACGSIRDLSQGKRLHSEARLKGYAGDVFVCNSIISMYGKCGDIKKAEEVFCMMIKRDVVSWNAMLSGYVEMEQGERALQLLRQMYKEGWDANNHTCVIALQACCIYADNEEGLLMDGNFVKPVSLSIGEGLHADAEKKGFLCDVYVGTALSSMYAKCGLLGQTERMFSGLSQRNVVSWNAMLSAYVERGNGAKALRLYRHMLDEGVTPDDLTSVISLQACGLLVQEKGDILSDDLKLIALDIGRALHVDVLCSNNFTLDVFIGTTLLDMYSKCGAIEDAEDVFCNLLERTAISWVAMLSAYVEQGQAEKALQLYCLMQEEGKEEEDLHIFNQQTFVIAFQACGMLVQEDKDSDANISIEIGMALHADACGHGYASDVIVGTAILKMYCNCGSIADAEIIFNMMNERDLVTWTIMLSAYVEQGQGEKALDLFNEMQKENVTIDEVTITCLLQVGGQLGSLELCRELHFAIVAAGCDNISSVIATLIHAYGNCASMGDGWATLDELPAQEMVPWTSCISGYTIEGNIKTAFLKLECSRLSGLQPDGITFCSLLSACDHSGYVTRALECFKSMSRDYGITPSVQHYEIMIDVFARAGNFLMVENMLGEMPMEATSSMWMSLLGACFQHNNSQLAKEAFDVALSLHPKEASPYIFMANAYAGL